MAKATQTEYDPSQDVATLAGGVLDRNEIDTPVSFADFIAEAAEHGLTEREQLEVVINPYTALNKDKDPLVDRLFGVRSVRFMVDEQTHQEYVQMWCVTEDGTLYRMTDGSSGIFRQIGALVRKRIADKHPTPFNFYVFPLGLRRSDFGLDKNDEPVKLGDPAMVQKASTYYLA